MDSDKGAGTIRTVGVGDYRLALEDAGTGRPTVVLEAGAGLSRATWDPVWARLAQMTRVVRYDRAGLGASEAAPLPRTFQAMVADLHRLLAHAGIPGPYVLVGHSLGGLLVRLFAYQHPTAVAGMVMIDAVHPQQNRRALAVLPPQHAEESAELATLRRNLTLLRTEPRLEDDPEQINYSVSEEQVRALGSLGAVPVIVLTQGQPVQFPPEVPADFATYIRERYHPMHQEFQAQLASLSTRGRQILALHSGHMIHQDEPEVVVATICEVVAMARADHGRAGAGSP
jgi:pimeloyl-ACP methyl ester carboxylesterase